MQAKDYAQVTLHSIADAVITTDVNGQIEYLNPKAEQMTGWDSEISRGLPVSRVFSLVGKDSCDSAEGALRHCLSTGMSIISSRDDTLRRHDGTLFSVRYSASPILANSGIPLGMILIFSDVTETRSMERKLTYQATHDALTGLINRTEFELRLTEAIESAQRQDEHHVLCYMDLDKLKLINDTCSHESGDKLIVQVTAILQGCIRDSDILARLGGDEYGLLIRNCSLHDAERLVEKMLTEIHAHRFATRGHTFEVSASIGVAPVDSGCENANQVMSAADLACYASKDAGGNRYHVYQVSDRQLVQRHDEMRWVSKLTEAIESDRLVLYYQDIVPVVSDDAAPHHFEILVRMLDEQGGIVPPGRFLPAAERYGLATSLDRWVVSHSFSWYAEHIGSQAEPGALCMSLNLSGASITDKRFLKFIIAGMRYHDIPPQAICFEITETAAIANLESAIEFILELRSLGCSFALDDFGSGLSSFAYLKHLPVDYLKIDGSFVKDMETDALDCAMVSSIHQIGSVIGIKTIAEFVENEQILKKLADIGVDYAQGYGIAKPAPLDDLTAASRQSA